MGCSHSSSPADDYLQTIDDASCVDYIPTINRCKVIDVYDGDTITVASRLPGSDTLYKFKVRLAGIDCPEKRTACTVSDRRHRCHQCAACLEKQISLYTTEVVRKMLLGKIVELSNVSTEKYGRLLATVLFDRVNVNEWLLTAGLAAPYDGNKKQNVDWLTRFHEAASARSSLTGEFPVPDF